MKKTRNRKRLHLAALILGAYAVCLGFGLVLAGLEDLRGAVGPIRLLLGLGMMGFGLFGVWDGLRDKIRPQKRPPQTSPTQYVLTDSSGNRTSNVTVERIRAELGKLREGEQDSFHLQLLTPLEIPEWGTLKQISCSARTALTLLAFFQTAEDGWLLRTKAMDFEAIVEWFRSLLEESLPLSGWNDGWETLEEIPGNPQESEDSENQEFRTWVLKNRAETYTIWHRQLTIVGEAWRNEYRFFTAHDVELAAQGVYEGKYQCAILEWGSSSFDLLPDEAEQLQVVWCTNIRDEKARRYFRKAGTVTQVKFWLIQYLNEGYMDEYWDEITDHANLQRRTYK